MVTGHDSNRAPRSIPILAALLLGVVGCDIGTDAPENSGVGTDAPMIPGSSVATPSGIDTLMDAGNPWIRLPVNDFLIRLTLDVSRWSATAIDSPLVDLTRPGRFEGASYLVADTLVGGDFYYSHRLEGFYRVDTGEATRILSDTTLPREVRAAAIPRLRIGGIELSSYEQGYKSFQYARSSTLIRDMDGDGSIRTAAAGGAPEVEVVVGRIGSLGIMGSDTSITWLVAGADGSFSTGSDNRVKRLWYVRQTPDTPIPNSPDTVEFEADDMATGASRCGVGAIGRLSRRDRVMSLAATIQLDSPGAFRNLSARYAGTPDSLWSSTDSTGAGVLNWVAGVGRTDTIRLRLEGSGWFRIPKPFGNSNRWSYCSRAVTGTVWKREDLEWTQVPCPDQCSIQVSGIFRFRRWAVAGGGLWANGTWSIDQWGQRTFKTTEAGNLP